MIDRYRGDEMAAVWDDVSKFRAWLEVELAVLEIREKLGQIPAGTTTYCRERTWVDAEVVATIVRRDKAIGHDLNAFVETMRILIARGWLRDSWTNGPCLGIVARELVESSDHDEATWNLVFGRLLSEVSRPEAALFHDGMTSYDTEEGATALQLMVAHTIVMKRLAELGDVLLKQSERYRGAIMMGRTHGQHAQPTTFGAKLLNYLELVRRTRRRFADSRDEIRVMKLSGAVGMYGTLGPEVEVAVAERLGLVAAPVSTQILALDRRAQLVNGLAEIAAVVEKIARDLWILAQTEIGEIREPFGKRQKGSSAMPHKKNPIGLEQLFGLPRLVRGYASALLENVATANERDISHSSVERIAFPDAFGLVDHMLRRLVRIVRDMEVSPERMLENIGLSYGTFASQKVEMLLKSKGMPAELAYRKVQYYSAAAVQSRESLLKVLKADVDVAARVAPHELDDCFDLKKWVAAEDVLYGRMK